MSDLARREDPASYEKSNKGKLTIGAYEREISRILDYFNDDELLLSEILYCPHTGPDACECKKPKTGLINICVHKYELKIEDCYVIGDMGKNEIIMAKNAGCKGILVLTGGGIGSLGEFRHTWAAYEADLIADNAYEAVKILDNGVKEEMHWIPISELDRYKAFPSFMKDYLTREHRLVEHIVSDERK